MLNKMIAVAAAGLIALSAATAGAAEVCVPKTEILDTYGADKEFIAKRALTVQDEITKTECSDCHTVFPPRYLTSGGWKKIMAGLDDHFGDDASLDADTVKHIEAYLVSKAMDASKNPITKARVKAAKKKGTFDTVRIFDLGKLGRKHRGELYLQMKKDLCIETGSGTNCIICHRGGERGVFEEFDGYGSGKGH